MKHYLLCWKDRNEKLHNSGMQRRRVIDWHDKVRAKELSSSFPQAKNCAMDKKVNLEADNAECIR